jgi:cytoskeletal protein RodZ
MGSVLPSNVPEFESVQPRRKTPRAPISGVVATIILGLALVAIIAVAVTRLTSGGLSRPTAATSPTQAASSASNAASAASQATAAAITAAGSPADSSTQQAIQQVIQQVDQAQMQAIQTNNPNVMAATATSAFYQEQVANNQDLVDNGVTDIKLLNLEWGPITVSGNTATATVWETWSTTFDDGTTEQSRDRNIYTLVRDNGTWKVQADDHPDSQAGAASTPGPAPGP